MVPLKQVWLFPATMKPLEPVREMIGMKWSCTKNHRKIRHIEWRKESVLGAPDNPKSANYILKSRIEYPAILWVYTGCRKDLQEGS
jgi:hypothetical protein